MQPVHEGACIIHEDAFFHLIQAISPSMVLAVSAEDMGGTALEVPMKSATRIFPT